MESYNLLEIKTQILPLEHFKLSTNLNSFPMTQIGSQGISKIERKVLSISQINARINHHQIAGFILFYMAVMGTVEGLQIKAITI